MTISGDVTDANEAQGQAHEADVEGRAGPSELSLQQNTQGRTLTGTKLKYVEPLTGFRDQPSGKNDKSVDVVGGYKEIQYAWMDDSIT